MAEQIVRAPDVIERPHCEKCGSKMRLTRIEPAEPGMTLQTFECAACGRSEQRHAA